jgi:hypothetical protein
MKRCIVLLLLLAAAATAFADSDSAARAKQLVQGSERIDEGDLGAASAKMTDLERFRAYDSAVEEIDGKLPLALGLNYVLGWGIGSFVQGDIKAGTGLLIGTLACDAAIVGGMVLLYGSLFSNLEYDSYGSGSSDYTSMLGPMLGGYGLWMLGGLGLSVVSVVNIVAPFVYATERRKAVRRGLMNGIAGAPSAAPRIAVASLPRASGPAAIGIGLRIPL